MAAILLKCEDSFGEGAIEPLCVLFSSRYFMSLQIKILLLIEYQSYLETLVQKTKTINVRQASIGRKMIVNIFKK